jgi:C_GCAxxG_C_C family probable redox protein
MESNMTREEQAVVYKQNGYNCCQAVTKVLADLAEVDEETLARISAGFGAGMGCMEATCGALVGATMMAGLIKEGKGTPMVAKEILKKFEEYSKATICKDLKGKETGVVLCSCDDCVRNGVRACCEVLGISDEL